MAKKKKPAIEHKRPEASEHVHQPHAAGDRLQHRPGQEEHGVRGTDSHSQEEGRRGLRTPKGAQRSKKKTESEWKIAG